MTLFILFPIGYQSQEDAGEVEPGTPAGAPSGPMVVRKLKQGTVITTVLWAALFAFIIWGGVSIQDLDWTARWRE
jgi:predicted secreted protein